MALILQHNVTLLYGITKLVLGQDGKNFRSIVFKNNVTILLAKRIAPDARVG